MVKPGVAIMGFASSAARASLVLCLTDWGLRVNERALMAVALGLGPHPADEMDGMR
jgi:hypothetical protein